MSATPAIRVLDRVQDMADWEHDSPDDGAVFYWDAGEGTYKPSPLKWDGTNVGYNVPLVSTREGGGSSVQLSIHDPTAEGTVGTDPGNVDDLKFGMRFRSGHWTNGPVGQEEYIDNVWAYGVNVGTTGTNRIDDTRASLGHFFEGQFFNSGKFASEYQMRFVDEAGGLHRVIDGFFPYDGGSGSTISFSSDIYNFRDFESVQRLKLDLSADQIFAFNLEILFDTNNVPLLHQRNAGDNGYIALPYIDDQDRFLLNRTLLLASSGLEARDGLSRLGVEVPAGLGVLRVHDITDEPAYLQISVASANAKISTTDGRVLQLAPDSYVALPGGNIGQVADGTFNITVASTGGTGDFVIKPVSGDTLLVRHSGNVGIHESSPDAAALIHMTSTTKGFLPPRMTTTQRDAITTPPVGLTIFNTTTDQLEVNKSTGWAAS